LTAAAYSISTCTRPSSVVDATPDAEPTADGADAYGVALDGDRIGTVTTYPASVTVVLDGSLSDGVEGGDGVAVTTEDGRVHVEIEYAAAVKRAVDVVAAVVRE
jgi:hypothetical protein